MNPSLRQLIERATSPIRHESGGMTNDALGAYRCIEGRFDPEVAAAVLVFLEEIAEYAKVFAGDIGSRGPAQREATVGMLRVRHVVQAEKILAQLNLTES